MRAPGCESWARSTSVENAALAAASLSTLRMTPPASVLCKISGLMSFIATGKPMRAAKLAASYGLVASASAGVARP